MKGRYQEIFHLVKEAIRQQDPLGLFKQGAPEDEYDEEIQRIVSGLQVCKTVEEIQGLIHRIFQESFGEEMGGGIEGYKSLAASILHCLNSKKAL